MSESIRNVGGFKGGRTIVHAKGCLTPRAPLWSASSFPSDAVIEHPVAFELNKVVIGVVRDLKSGWKPKYTRVSEANFIGEKNRCNYYLSSKNKSYPCPPPHTVVLHSTTKIFSQFFELY